MNALNFYMNQSTFESLWKRCIIASVDLL